MESLSSEDDFEPLSERPESYSLSADVSESESSSGFFPRRRYGHECLSSSLTSSPLAKTECDDNSGFRAPVTLPVVCGRRLVIRAKHAEEREMELSEIELMKERFAKLLLGEDMSGGGQGVCSALAISNAITNLSATVFGELWKLEPLAPQKKLKWHREMEWLLCVSDSIVELIPSVQELPGGGTYEVMVPRPRADLHANLPALKKLDAMLLGILDGFQDSEFYYVDRGIIVSGSDNSEANHLSAYTVGPSVRQEEKWWLPFPKVPPNGLSPAARKKLQQSRECTNQILKAAMAINSTVLNEMEIPIAYLESLPKSGKACLGEILYRFVTAKQFSPESVLDFLDFSSEYTTLDIANRIEAAMHIWRQKYLKKHSVHTKARKSSLGGKIKDIVDDIEKSKYLASRAESLLRNLRLQFPRLPQTALDMSKIQYNEDVGQSILESYSRVMESLAFNIIARIEDLLYVDDVMKQRAAESTSLYDRERLRCAFPKNRRMSHSTFSVHHSSSPFTMPEFHSSHIDGSPDGRSNHAITTLRSTPDERLEKFTFQ